MYTWSARACADNTVKTVKSVNSHDGLVLEADMAAMQYDLEAMNTKDSQINEEAECCDVVNIVDRTKGESSSFCQLGRNGFTACRLTNHGEVAACPVLQCE